MTESTRPRTKGVLLRLHHVDEPSTWEAIFWRRGVYRRHYLSTRQADRLWCRIGNLDHRSLLVGKKPEYVPLSVSIGCMLYKHIEVPA